MNKQILLIDMDGVMCSFEGAMSILAPHIFIGDGDDYVERSKLVNEVCSHPDNCRLFKDLEPIDGAVGAINELKEKYEILFCSTPMSAVPESFTDKALWLYEHFGEWSHGKLILTHRKDLVIGDFLIDDTLRNGVLGFTGEHIHFGTEQFPDWDSVLKYLL